MYICVCSYDIDLSLMFLSKPQTERPACEVQAHLDEFLRNYKRQRGHVSQHVAAAITSVGGAVDCNMSPVKSSVGVGIPDSLAAKGTTLRQVTGHAGESTGVSCASYPK